MPTPTLFLDRDGVINVDHGYVHRADQFEFIPGILELVRFAVRELGWFVVVITNQAGIGRGYYDEATYQILTQWMCDRFEAAGAPIARVYHCPYHPTHGVGEYRRDHPWRKPRPGMILQAATDLDLDLASSAVVGDKIADIEAGAAAGVGLLIRLDAKHTPAGERVPAHTLISNPAEAIAVLRQFAESRESITHR